MIIVRLKGGLGNQMFQYAAGRRLAHFHNTLLKLDLSWFNNCESGTTARSFALKHFCINADPAARHEIDRFSEMQVTGVKRLVNFYNPWYRNTHFRGQNFNFDSAVLELPDNIYLDGYWQSEKYFKDIDSIIRRDFSFCMDPEGLNKEVAAIINSCNSVSVHFRRGDYVTDEKIAAQHGICTRDYYDRAINRILEQVEQPHFFLFSDDPVWVRDNFINSHMMTLVDHNGPDMAHKDLQLMSLCRHHIIANSSLSWWGAWLADRTDKLVFSPSRWFYDTSLDTSDLIPFEWFQL